ncbi:MAG: histone deacetylase [Armatimonadetes bacterium]|nr:histone deacetylase [Armatimonadota bacterium]
MKAGIIYHPDYLKHDTGMHIENAKRLEGIIEALKDSSLNQKLIYLEPKIASINELTLVHSIDYIKYLEEFCQKGGGWIDADTYASPLSFKVAALAAGGAIKAVEHILKENFSWIFLLCRPPGHHAVKDKAMGFCLLNNAAIAASFAQEKLGLNKIFIIDWDIHHGNGTQEIFYDNPNVFYFSIHQSPFYPGTGKIQEQGNDRAFKTNLNLPLPGGLEDDDYLYILKEIFIPRAKEFNPELIIVSAGFDAHSADPIGGMRITDDGFSKMAALIQNLANETQAQGKMLAVLEGGYNLDQLPRTVLAILETWLTEKSFNLDNLNPSPYIEKIAKEFKEIIL